MLVRRSLRLLGVIGLLAALVWIGIGVNTGIRYPVLQHEPGPAPTHFESRASGVRGTTRGAYVEGSGNGVIRLRAVTPHPLVSIESDSAQSISLPIAISLHIGNVHPDARLIVPPTMTAVDEQIQGLERRLTASLTGPAEIRWQFPQRDSYRFAAIGDTGAGLELQWCLQRAVELGADFILHLGDLYYPPTALAQGRVRFDQAQVPVYVAIGNHDFHRGLEPLPAQYTRLFGPRNYSFRLGDTEFVNLDTAAATFPVSGAERGRLVSELPALGAPGTDLREYLVFTHRPPIDPRPGKSHDVGGREARWLRERLTALGVTTVLAGHIHRSIESRDGGMTTYVAGDGLADVDLIAGKPVAQILIGELTRGEPLAMRWEPLNMPLEAHCHPDVRDTLREANRPEQITELARACAGMPGWE